MFNWITRKRIFQPAGIEIRQSPLHGRGVFALHNFYPGDTIEIAPVILLDNAERDFLQMTTLYNYYFLINKQHKCVALGLGYSSLYNHTYKANAVYSISVKKAWLFIKAGKIILPGEEITLNYNGHPEDETPVYF